MPSTKIAIDRSENVFDSLQKDALVYALKTVAPGTPIREGLNYIIKGGMGGIIVIGGDEKVIKLAHGGFAIDCPFTPMKLFELAKMDGAIVVSSDLKKIAFANTHLMPEINIPSEETGTRHRSAQKVAKETGNLVVAVSERKSTITIYIGNIRYVLQDSKEIVVKAGQALQTLEKYRKAANEILVNLTSLEFENSVTLFDVLHAAQKLEQTQRIANEIQRYILELGEDGRLTEMQLFELTYGFDREYNLLLHDYASIDSTEEIAKIKKNISELNNDELLDFKTLADTIGYTSVDTLDIEVPPKGYRILNKINKINVNISEKIIGKFKTLDNLIMATPEQISDVEGISLNRAKYIKENINRIKGQTIVELYKEI